MTLNINDGNITSNRTEHTARPSPGNQHSWEVSWLQGRLLDRNSAITAMMLADASSRADLDTRHRLWPHVEGWAAELGLTANDAVTRIREAPDRAVTEQRSASLPDREAAE